MIKKIRFFFWLSSAIVKRHGKIIIITTISSFFLILLMWRYNDIVRFTLFPNKKVIGVVGQFTPATLPRFIQDKISVGLTQLSADHQTLPAVSESWTVKDGGKTYIFKLRNDLIWHDGKIFKASDVNYNFKDVTITPINTEILKITLKEPFSPLPSLLSKPLFKENFIGLGPMRVSGLTRKGKYIKKIKLQPLDPDADSPQIIKFYPTVSQAVTAFMLGEINTLRLLEEPMDLYQWDKYLTIKKEENQTHFISVLFKTNAAPVADKSLRQALAYSIPNEITKGNVKSPIAEASWAYNNTLKKIDFNKDKALEYFEKSGLATTSAELTIHTFPNLLDIANELSEAWNSVLGLKIQIKVINALPEKYTTLLTILEIPQDPDQYPLWHSTQTNTNITGLNNPKIDKLLEDGRKTFSIEKRKKIYDEFQKYLMDELPAIFLFHPTIYTISRS